VSISSISSNKPLITFQLGGLTLTTTVLYLTTTLHSRNRAQQAALLRQQQLVLDNIHSPAPKDTQSPSREVQMGLLETAKDKWNKELEENVRRLQKQDWAGIRDRMEEGVANTWRRAFEKGTEAVKEVSK
jgi:altered-inheritance-of-mitochondria protein 5